MSRPAGLSQALASNAGSAETPSVSEQGTPSRRQDLFDQVNADHGRMISRIVSAYEADPALQKDLLQEVLFAVWRALPTFEGRSSLKTFVAGIAHKRAATHVSRATARLDTVGVPSDFIDGEPLPDEAAVRDEQSRLLSAAIQDLPIPQRQAIVLALEGFTPAEIAEALRITTGAAMNRVSRAKTALTNKLRRQR